MILVVISKLKCSLIIHYAKKKNKIYVKNRNSITYTKIHNYRKYFFSVSIES